MCHRDSSCRRRNRSIYVFAEGPVEFGRVELSVPVTVYERKVFPLVVMKAVLLVVTVCCGAWAGGKAVLEIAVTSVLAEFRRWNSIADNVVVTPL